MKKLSFLSIFFVFLIGCQDDSEIVIPVVPEKVFYSPEKMIIGSDLSFVNQLEDNGAVYKDSSVVKDPYAIFKSKGANVIRVRLWHNPTWTGNYNGGMLYSNLADVTKTIRRSKEAGMQVCLDIHYSDSWADPSKQTVPQAWQGLNHFILGDSVYQYTRATLDYLQTQELVPEFVQIGNETNQGMLWPAGKVVNNDWIGFAELVQKGIQAVRDFSSTSTIKPQIILHVAQMKHAEYYTNGLTSAGVTDFDIIGISHYYQYADGMTMSTVTSTIQGLKNTYDKKIMIMETSYPWTSDFADNYSNLLSGNEGFANYGVSIAAQRKYMIDLTQAVIAGGGSGIFYWEPAWISTAMKDQYGTGSPYENETLFNFVGNATSGFDYMTWKYNF
ncbi:MAG: glycosyl hydrolase 53 family protein [Saprospiraceae bacterium]